MDDKNKVTLISMCKQPITLSFPELRITRTFPRKGSKISFDKNAFSEMVYDPGLTYMLENGMLYIEDMEVKKEIGLEPEDADEPKNIKILTDAEMKRYLTVLPANELQTKIKSLKREQIEALVDFAIENEYSDYSRCEVIKKLTGRDIIRAIQLNHQAKEPVKEDEE